MSRKQCLKNILGDLSVKFERARDRSVSVYSSSIMVYTNGKYSADRSDVLFRSISYMKANSHLMDEEEILFGIERVLIDSVQILDNNSGDPDTLDWLFDTVSQMGNKRLGMPENLNVFDVVEHADRGNVEEMVQNMIRPRVYERQMTGVVGRTDTIFIYRCFHAASLIAEKDSNRMPGYDFAFTVDAARAATDVVGEWLFYSNISRTWLFIFVTKVWEYLGWSGTDRRDSWMSTATKM